MRFKSENRADERLSETTKSAKMERAPFHADHIRRFALPRLKIPLPRHHEAADHLHTQILARPARYSSIARRVYFGRADRLTHAAAAAHTQASPPKQVLCRPKTAKNRKTSARSHSRGSSTAAYCSDAHRNAAWPSGLLLPCRAEPSRLQRLRNDDGRSLTLNVGACDEKRRRRSARNANDAARRRRRVCVAERRAVERRRLRVSVLITNCSPINLKCMSTVFLFSCFFFLCKTLAAAATVCRHRFGCRTSAIQTSPSRRSAATRKQKTPKNDAERTKTSPTPRSLPSPPAQAAWRRTPRLLAAPVSEAKRNDSANMSPAATSRRRRRHQRKTCDASCRRQFVLSTEFLVFIFSLKSSVCSLLERPSCRLAD